MKIQLEAYLFHAEGMDVALPTEELLGAVDRLIIGNTAQGVASESGTVYEFLQALKRGMRSATSLPAEIYTWMEDE